MPLADSHYLDVMGSPYRPFGSPGFVIQTPENTLYARHSCDFAGVVFKKSTIQFAAQYNTNGETKTAKALIFKDKEMVGRERLELPTSSV